jgi:hypothetical protein
MDIPREHRDVNDFVAFFRCLFSVERSVIPFHQNVDFEKTTVYFRVMAFFRSLDCCPSADVEEKDLSDVLFSL